jgi:hypothetical protein
MGEDHASPASESGDESPHFHVCRDVAQRAAQTLKWADESVGAPLLDFAINHLSLGRALL